MRIAYHPNAANMSDYALRVWLAAASIDVFSGGGVVVSVGTPKHPYSFGVEVTADDRETQAGQMYSRVRSVKRRGVIEFPVCSPTQNDVWKAWYVATLGGRVPFMIEDSLTSEWVTVKAKNAGVPTLTEYQLYQPATLEVVEWL